MTLNEQDTYPVEPRNSGETYIFQFAYFGSFEVQVEVCASENRNMWFVLPTTGYYSLTRTGAGSTPGGVVVITNPGAADTYLRDQLTIKYPGEDWSSTVYTFVAISRKMAINQTQAQTLSYSGGKVETSDDRIVMLLQQIDDMLMAVYNLSAIWDLEYSKLTRNYIPKCNQTDTMKLVDSTISDDGTTVLVANNLDVTGAFNADGAATLGATLDVTGAVHFMSTLQVDGTSTLQAVTATTITTSSNVSVGGALSVVAATTLNGTLTVAGSATFNSPAYFKSHVSIDGATTAHAIIATTITTTGTVNVGGALFCSSTSEFVGSSIFRSTVDVYGTLWARTNFNVAANSVFYGNVEIKGTTTAQAINATSVTAPQITSTDNLTFGKTFIMDGQTFRMGQISETIQNFYLFKVAAQSDGSWVIYMAPDANDGTGEPPENAPPFNNFAIGDGMGDVKASRMDQDDNLEHIITPYDFIANTIKAERDLVVARNFILDGGIYNTLSLEGTYVNEYFLQVIENTEGNRELVWAAASGGATANVDQNVLAMGGPEGELVNSMLVQNSISGYITTGYGLSSRDIKLQSNIAEGSTTIGSMNTQTTDWRVFFDFRGLDQMNQGEIAPLYAKYYGGNTISIIAGTELSPDLFVSEPAIDHALAVWNGHDSEFENKYINNVTPPSLQDYVMSNAIFTDELLITSHANLMYPFGLSSNMIYLDVDKATEFYGDYATSCNITLIGDMIDGHEIVIALRRVDSGGLINWPTEWRWSMKFAPISSNFPIMQYVIILLQRNGSVYYAKRINAQALQEPDTSKVIVLGTHRDNGPLNFFDTQGYKLEVVNQGTIYSNVLNGLVLNTLCVVKSSYSDTRTVVIANNVLDIVLGAETEFVVKVQHDEDIAAVNITFDADEIPTNVVIRFSIIMMKGLSIQKAIPMPNGIKAPAVIETNELLLGDYNNTIFQFVAIPGNGLYYIGGIGQ